MQVPAGDLDVAMTALTATANVDGILVTMPHKFSAFAHCATSSERSRMLGVVSVIRRNPDGTWHGDMLDGLAFVKAQTDHGAHLEGARALLVGAGGAGSAIAIELLAAAVSVLVIHDAAESQVRAPLDLLVGFGDGRVIIGPPDPTGCDLVFNATPMGMEDGDPLPVSAALLTPSMFVGDVIAGHGVTPFIKAAQAAGCKTATKIAAPTAQRIRLFVCACMQRTWHWPTCECSPRYSSAPFGASKTTRWRSTGRGCCPGSGRHSASPTG
jgi:shikimate dehydrogenase